MNSSTRHRRGTAFIAVLFALALPLAACQKTPVPAGAGTKTLACELVTDNLVAGPSAAPLRPSAPKHGTAKAAQACDDIAWSPDTRGIRFVDPPAHLQGTRFLQAR